MSKSSNTLLGMMAGVIVGMAVGILIAPESGVKTRKKLKKGAEDIKGVVNNTVSDVKDSIVDTASDLKDNVMKTAGSKKVTLDAQLESIISDVSHKTGDVISTLEKKLAYLKEKNKKFQKS